MRFDYFQYRVEVKNLKFTTDEGVVHPKTAIITLLGEKKETLGVELFGYRENGDWYQQIKAGESPNMNQCYVRDFSLAAYRSAWGLNKKEYVKIAGITARNAFFEARVLTDFSFTEFADGNVDFEYTHFCGGPVSFNSVRLGAGNPVFNNVLFRNGNVDFGNAIFGAGIKGFKNSVFREGKKDFQYCDFGSGEVSFNNTEFHRGEVSFINAVFGEGNVSFKIARITEGKVDFHYAKFGKGNISFERVEFGDSKVDFRAVEFNAGRVNFNRSVFGEGDVSFEGSELPSGRFSFKRADLGKGLVSFELVDYSGTELFFEKTRFGEGNISFQGGQFDLLSFQSCHLDHYLDLRVVYCRYLDLSDTIARDIIDLKPYDQDVKIYVLNLSGMRLLGRMYIDWKENQVGKIIRNQDSGYKLKSEQFRILKENYRITGQYADEDKAYVWFKRYEALDELETEKKKGGFPAVGAYLEFAFKWLVFDKIGLYATDPVRVLVSMIFAYLIFSLIYYVLPFIADTHIVSSLHDPDHLSQMAVAFYHSAITFLTIGYGDYYPSGIIRWISGFEGFVGLFMMSYFTVAFVRKILR